MLRAFPAFDPARTTFPMFKLMLDSLPAPAAPARRDAFDLPEGADVGAFMQGVFDRFEESDQ